MLQAMGWREGSGLGRKCQGITAPIEVSREGCFLDEVWCLFFFFSLIQKHSLLKISCGRSCAVRSKAASAHISSCSSLSHWVLKLGQSWGSGRQGCASSLRQSAPKALRQRACARAAYPGAAWGGLPSSSCWLSWVCLCCGLCC